ncbi:MAG: DNA polymerase III subunit delta [Candidatus Cloacimonetes bacterium]|nr:DNA polymerase III subunit delta [Candidatus Cloacimonadota bacterium]MCF7813657.1 DNA polymerase III subunit delta [Candidatus Cloacimonadota bacterium]MCF7869147.1 DNA polymerase III subunit delta [Candidatus Cloacimonadota bacterium]MCF7882493.1 DNA polymerase III subunit delta [Candidatus Cloacimonadota bacterium]
MAKKRIIPHYEFLREFKHQKPAPVYYVVGTEAYLKDKVYHAIKARFCDDDSDDFDFTLLYGDSDESVQALENLEMSPFLAETRLVVIKNFDQMNANGKNQIAKYCEKPSKTSILVLIADKSDGRSNANKIIEKEAVTISCRRPYSSDDIVRWLRTELRVKNIKMDNQAINRFAGSIEPDYLIASNELEKLIIYTKNRGTINSDEVEEVIGKSKTNKIFDLQDAIGKRNLKNAARILDNMLMNNEPAVYIITMLSRFFVQIWKVLALRRRSISDSEISGRYLNDVFYKYRNDYLNYADSYTLSETKKSLSLLLQADIDAKSLNINEDILLYMLLFKICATK